MEGDKRKQFSFNFSYCFFSFLIFNYNNTHKVNIYVRQYSLFAHVSVTFNNRMNYFCFVPPLRASSPSSVGILSPLHSLILTETL